MSSQVAQPESTLPDAGTEELTDERVDERVGRLWRVICHDDPLTTMDFVVDVFTGVFRMPTSRAFERMMRVHNTGSAVLGLWPESVAQRKVDRTHSLARTRGFPLTLTLEEDD
ncbi:MAG: ATP-dependent Clp protease adaptor ClpS [Planctomycetota bacterium]